MAVTCMACGFVCLPIGPSFEDGQSVVVWLCQGEDCDQLGIRFAGGEVLPAGDA